MSAIGKQRLAETRKRYFLRRQEIYKEYKSGIFMGELAKKYNVTVAQISNLVDRAENENNTAIQN